MGTLYYLPTFCINLKLLLKNRLKKKKRKQMNKRVQPKYLGEIVSF